MTDFDDMERSFIVEGLDDYVGLWRFAKRVRARDPSATDDEVRHEAIRRVGRLLDEGLMQAGALLRDGGFEVWGLNPGDSVQRIEREWTSLGGDPSIADICWFQNTELGDRWARKFVQEIR